MNIIKRSDAKKKGLTRYFTGIECVNGHIEERFTSNGDCLGCSRDRRAREDYKSKAVEYRKSLYSTDEYKEYKREYCKKRRMEDKVVREREKKYRDTDEYREKNRIYMREYRKRDIHKIHKERKNKARRTPEFRQKERKRIKNSKEARITRFCRDSLRRVFKLSRKDKKGRTFDILGYTKADFMKRIESTMLDGMSWDNYGDWHIDHITPISHMIKQGITDPAEINRLDNLQALWKSENLSKGSKVERF